MNPLLEWAVKTSGEHEETKGMYEYPSPLERNGVADTDVFSPNGERISVTVEASLVGRELQRQQAAWEKVESCRADGGSDCMKYSSTATADEEDGKVAGDMASDASGSSVVYFVKLRWTCSALNLDTVGVQLEHRRRLVPCFVVCLVYFMRECLFR